jgi:hypothetical protein
MTTIMVQIADAPKTQEALHFACALARGKQDKVILVKMVPVQHWEWIGTELGFLNLTERDGEEMRNYQKIAETYHVKVEVQLFQYVTLPEAIAEAADYVDAQFVFGALPPSFIPYWHKFQVWLLRQRLAQQGRQLYLLEHNGDSAHWTPAILVRADHTPHSRS